MKKVMIINGTYGHKPEGSKFINPVRAGEVVEVSDEEAVRLMELGVAQHYIEIEPEMLHLTVATEAECENADDTDGNLPYCENGVLDIVDGRFTVASLMEMKRADMEKLAVDLGVDISKCKNKSEIAEVLVAVEVETDELGDSETPPNLSTSLPVT